jgi:hypothetical protein
MTMTTMSRSTGALRVEQIERRSVRRPSRRELAAIDGNEDDILAAAEVWSSPAFVDT